MAAASLAPAVPAAPVSAGPMVQAVLLADGSAVLSAQQATATTAARLELGVNTSPYFCLFSFWRFLNTYHFNY
jgi:hypothetical protein